MTIDTQSVCLQKTGLVFLLASVVATILWMTPLPDPYFMSCERPCHELEWPMICRIRLTIEVYQTLSSSCGKCPQNVTDCWNSFCVTADGKKRGILTANRQLPGPVVQACENDILVVDVVNRVPNHGLAIHWRGLPQKDTPFMDGVPMVTQCPIPSYTTFQYKFRAARPGTHLWHAHGGAEMADGLAGALVVRRAPSREPHAALYDVDSGDHVIVIAEWTHDFALQRLLQDDPQPDALLINGRAAGKEFPEAQFFVERHKRYRFRVAHAGVISACPIKIRIDEHSLKIIEVDGSPIEPQDVASVTLASGERVDFVIDASSQDSNAQHKITAQSTCSADVRQTANLVYTESNSEIAQVAAQGLGKVRQELVTPSQDCGTPKDALLCLAELRALAPVPPGLAKTHVRFNVELPFDFGESVLYMGDQEGRLRVPHVSNLTFTYPPSPLVTQAQDVPVDVLCRAESRSPSCPAAVPCECVHVVDIPLGVSAQLTLRDLSSERSSSHVFHLHGYAFHVVRSTPDGNVTLSPAKDTVTVPAQGNAVIRFVADNPGYWLLENYSARGLSVILHVGDAADLPVLPPDFPRCGSWIGPDFFL